MKQTVTQYADRTSSASEGDVFKSNTALAAGAFDADKDIIELNLMDKRTEIFKQMNINGDDWNEAGPEDVTFGLAWRHNFRVNQYSDPKEWSPFIFTPHLRVAGTFAVGKAKDPDVLLSLPFGNNGHHAIHASGGFGVDFYDTVEFSIEGGATHYFDRTYTERVPTHKLQSLLFPYKTEVKVEPGKTWHMAMCLNAHNFIDHLSVYAQYSYLNHGVNSIALTTPDAAFIPSRLEEQTNYKAQMLDVGFNYDLSPNMTFGFLWQAPLSQRGTYKAHSILLSGILTF